MFFEDCLYCFGLLRLTFVEIAERRVGDVYGDAGVNQQSFDGMQANEVRLMRARKRDGCGQNRIRVFAVHQAGEQGFHGHELDPLQMSIGRLRLDQDFEILIF